VSSFLLKLHYVISIYLLMKLRTLLLLLVGCLGQYCAIAQAEDSLRTLINKTATADTTRILAMADLASRLRNLQPDSCLYLAKAAYEKAVTINYLKGQGRAKRVEGVYYQNAKGNYSIALRLFRQAMKIAIQADDKLGQAYTCNSIASIYRQQALYDDALSYYFKAIQLYNETNQTHLPIYANTYYSIGYIYHNLGFYDKALFYYRRSQMIFQDINDKQGLATVYNKIGEIYEQSGKLQDALVMQWKGLALVKSINSPFLMTFAYASMSWLHLKMNQKDSAIWYAEEGMKIAYTHQSAERLAHLQTVSAACYNANQEYEMAYEYALEAKKTAKQLGAVEYYVGACEQYYLASKALGNYQEALIEYEKFVHLKDSIQGAKNQRMVLAKEFAYEEGRIKIEQQKKELQYQLADEQQRQVMYSLAGTIIALVVILLLVYKNNRVKQKLNNLLNQKRQIIEHKNQELETANSTKDKLFSIIGHDLRSPLASLKSLLGLATDGTVTIEELLSLLPSLQKNVESIYDTLENLLQWSYSQMNGIQSNPTVFNITHLIENNLALFTEAAKNKRISLQTNVNEAIWVKADEQQILLVLRNLINNAIKFTNQGGEITVFVSLVKDFLIISIIDDGVGMSREVQKQLFLPTNSLTTRGTQGEKGSGLGLKLCKEMVESNGGEIWVESELNKGSKFRFTVPLAAT